MCKGSHLFWVSGLCYLYQFVKPTDAALGPAGDIHYLPVGVWKEGEHIRIIITLE